MVSIGEYASIDGRLYMRQIEASSMTVMPIAIGKGANVGTRATIYGGSAVGNYR